LEKIRVAISDLGGAIDNIKDRKFVGVRMHLKSLESKIGLTNNPACLTDRLAHIENALFHPETGIQQAVVTNAGIAKQAWFVICRLREKGIVETPKSSNGFNPYPEMAPKPSANVYVPGVGFVSGASGGQVPANPIAGGSAYAGLATTAPAPNVAQAPAQPVEFDY
jgi:hypothetical protein